jgi:hypothetical protein
MRQWVFAALLAVLGGPVAAQTAEVHASLQMSADFARVSNDALLTGDRAGAIVAALRGLPEGPRDTDFATFAGAHLALYRAVASRSLRWARTGDQYYSVNRDGTRALVGDFGTEINGPVSDAPYLLIDPAARTTVATLASPHEASADTAWLGASPRFSPDGRVLAVPSFRSSGTMLYDAATGAELRRLDGLFDGFQVSRIGIDLGFSPDGRHYALVSGDLLGVWDTGSGALLSRLDIGRDKINRPWPIGWGHDGQMLVIHPTGPQYPTGIFTSIILQRWTVAGQVTPLLDLTAFQGIGTNMGLPSPWGPHLLVYLPNRQVVLDLSSGRVVVDLEPDADAQILANAFVRNGAAYAHLDLLAPPEVGLRVFDLATGTEVSPTLADHAPFLHLLHNPDGQPIASMQYDLHHTFRGEGLPEGRALYDFVWSALPEALRSDIGGNRVARP